MTITYDQAFEKLDSLVESALLSYDVEILTEEGEGEEGSPKAKNFLAAALAAVKKLWARIAEFLVALTRKAAAGLAKVKEITYPAGAYAGAADPTKIIAELNRLSRPNSELSSEPFLAKLDKDVTVNAKVAIDNAKKIAVMAKRLAAVAVSTNGDTEAAKTWIDNVRTAAGWVNKISAATGTALKGMINSKASDKALDKAAKKDGDAGKAKDKLVNNEGVEMTREQKMAQLLIEAAQILAEEGDGDETHTDGVEGGEGTQKPVDEIPEEKPAEATDPCPTVSGGEGEKVDLEEIKELTGGDAEAIALLTDDEGGTVCESVTIDFGF